MDGKTLVWTCRRLSLWLVYVLSLIRFLCCHLAAEELIPAAWSFSGLHFRALKALEDTQEFLGKAALLTQG